MVLRQGANTPTRRHSWPKPDCNPHSVPMPITKTPYAESILISFRRIARAIELFSRELESRFDLTVSQLLCMRQLLADGPLPPSELARRIYLSQATVTGILNRLESREVIKRERIGPDRRVVTVSLTAHGRKMLEDAPLPLQKHFYDQFSQLPEKKQVQITKVLAQVVEMMESQDTVIGEPPKSNASSAEPANA